MNAKDYWNAIGVARRQAGKSLLGAAAAVAYARLVRGIGPRYYSLMCLHHLPPSRWSEYIVDAESNPIVRAINSPQGRALATDKVAFHRRLGQLGVPSATVLGLIGSAPRPDGPQGAERVLDRATFVREVAAAHDRLFFKPTNRAHGEGAFIARRSGTDWEFAGRRGSAGDLFDHCERTAAEGPVWLVQPALRPHAAIAAAISPGALGTVRVVTMRGAAGVEVLAAAMKMPVGDNLIDNFGEGLNGNLVADVDLATGILGGGVQSLSREWPEITGIERHPDTGCRIEGFRLPLWPQLIEVVSRGQAGLPELPTLGWDIAITDDGPVVVEANAGYGVDIIQLASRRGLRKLLSKVYALPRWQDRAPAERAPARD